jgi:hypothetical protein
MAGGNDGMSYEEPLSKSAVAISISESPDMSVLGLGPEHLVDAMAEVARHLLAMGARLMYGGDLRPDGFTNILFELVARYRRDADLGDERVGVTNFMAWPVHVTLSEQEVARLSEALSGVADLVYLDIMGHVMSLDERKKLNPSAPSNEEWASGLTAMRARMTQVSDARIVLGGKIEHFKGKMPGVAEEALEMFKAHKPLFILGGFGGCARDIAEDLGLVSSQSSTPTQWAGRSSFDGFGLSDLNNGLQDQENVILATTHHIDEAVTLILRGLLRVAAGLPT